MRSSELSPVQLTDLRKDVQQLIAQLREDVEQARRKQRAEMTLVNCKDVVDMAEQASNSALRVEALAHLQQLESEIRVAEHAIQRMDSGSYGDCEHCGEMIELNRLKANPVAVLCMRCQTELEG